MYYLKTEHTFDSAHFLKGYDGKCSNLHGHCWRVAVMIGKEELQKEGQTKGMVLDFSDLKKEVRNLCEDLDHCLIYEQGSLKEATLTALRDEAFRLVELPFRPTAENLAKYFYGQLKEKGLPVTWVEVYETEQNCAAYEERTEV